MKPESFSYYEIFRNYSFSIKDYVRKTNQIKQLQSRYGGVTTNSSVNAEIQSLDEERHQNHVRCVELGNKLGKNKSDVLIDILKEQGGLEEYGLPEFEVRTRDHLKEEDVDDTEAEGGMTPHEGTEVFGVAFDKKNLEKVLSIIRDNPKKFRLGQEFYK